MTGAPRAILAVDTATDEPGVALRKGSRTFVRPIGWRASFREAAPAVSALLAEAGLDLGQLGALAVPSGPGSFTGLRVGATLAIAIARARRIALHGVPTLAAVAEAYAPSGAERVCAILDARRGRWYVALYERRDGGWRAVAGPEDLDPEAVGDFAGGAPLAGPVVGSESDGPAAIAAAIASLVARDPEGTRVPSPGRLDLVYARSGVGG